MDRQILYPAEIPLVEDGLNAQRNAMVGVGHLASAAFGANTVAASGFACSPADGLAVTIAPGALLAPGVVDASAYGTLAAVSSALVRQFISRDPVTLAAPAAGATYIVYVSPQTVDTDDTVLPFYNAADPSVTYAGQNNSGLTAPTVRRDEAVLGIGAAPPDGSHPLWLVTVPAGATAITADMVSVASGAPFYPSLAAVAPRIVAPFNAQLAAAMGGYPLNAVVADTTTPGTFWVSTADANVSVPGATGATWQSLFNGYATEAWATGQFLQLAATALQAVTGPVAFNGATTVPDITDFTGKNALNAETADGRYIKSASSTVADFVTYFTINKETKLPFVQSPSFNGPLQPYGDYALVSELPTAGTITGGTYTKTPMNDGTGRSVLVQRFAISAPDHAIISFLIPFTTTDGLTINLTPEFQESNTTTNVANYYNTTLSTASFELDLRYLQNSSSGAQETAQIINVTAAGIVS
ncbi:MAG: hypothetical protein ABF628_08445 [Acetobacter orientalis]|uniref:hypothetical protein n=1 Tax=Acetobacter orientalis TaxID=146474 RepID=UPI0039EC5F60